MALDQKESDNRDPSTSDNERFSQICKALGHPTRIEIVRYLKKIDRCVCQQIVDILPLSQSTVSQHLKILKMAGIIEGEVEGPRTCYCLNPDTIANYKQMVQHL